MRRAKKISEQKTLEEEANKLQMRYYFWDWCSSYGWRQQGSADGYETLEKLEKDCEWSFKNSENWKILTAHVLQNKKSIE